jgi:transposase-like protein
MGRTSKIDKLTKIRVVKDYLDGKASLRTLAKEIGVDCSTVRRWVYEFRVWGEASFCKKGGNKSYSREFQLEIVKKYLAGEGSLLHLCMQYDIKHHSILNKWVKKYNQGVELEGYEPHSEVYHMKTRKTTIEERIEIAKWCVDHKMNYRETAAKFAVPYALVYQWVKKYLKDGESGLKYQKRGRHVPLNLDLLTEEERLKVELETTKRKLQLAELTIEVLKKKKEIENRLASQESSMIRNTKPFKN